MEFIFEILVVYLFNLPGALIRWAVLNLIGHKKTLKEYLELDITQNASIGIVFFLLLYIYHRYF